MFEFKTGDIVEFGGLQGTVASDNYSDAYPIIVKFSDSYRVIFTLDGRFHTAHVEPLLKLISRPKKKVKRIVETEVYYSPSFDCSYPLNSVQVPGDCILVTLAKEIEVEV